MNLAARYRYMPTCSVISYGAQIISLPPPTNILAEWNLYTDSYYLVVCRLEPENHVLEIVRGYAAAGSALPLIIVGHQQSNTSYVAQLLAIQDARIHFIGTVYDQIKLRALRYHCRAYFHGHSVGGTNPSLLEALGCGNTVIAHDNPFNREVARDSARYFVAEADVSTLVEQMEGDELSRDAMRNQAREIIASRYTWEKVTEDYLRLLID
jgi:glycosyltransferase involved in cell wall biosynthesis